jgi:hypothetical protein
MSGLAMSSSGLTALSTIKQIYRTQRYRRRLRPSHSETSQTATSKCEPTNDACRTATRRRRPSSTSCDVEATTTPSSPCTRWKLSATSWTTSLTASSQKRNPLESIGRHRTSIADVQELGNKLQDASQNNGAQKQSRRKRRRRRRRRRKRRRSVTRQLTKVQLDLYAHRGAVHRHALPASLCCGCSCRRSLGSEQPPWGGKPRPPRRHDWRQRDIASHGGKNGSRSGGEACGTPSGGRGAAAEASDTRCGRIDQSESKQGRGGRRE